MEKATICLRNSILGWVLVPSYRHPSPPNGVESWLTELYGEDWSKMKPSERAFMKGEPIDKVIAHIKDVCKGMGIKVSFCGNLKAGPTIRLWRRHPLEFARPEEISVDPKWGCWTEDEGIWNDYAPGVWDKMLKAFTGEAGPVKIHTGPRKECRYGSVTIEKGKASGYFCTNWDECCELADTLETECDDAFCEMIPHSVHMMEPGMDWDFGYVKARKFVNLMRKIDNEENELLVMDKREWGYIEACFKKETTPA